MNLLFVGAYGIKSIGDDAMMVALVDGLRKITSSVDVTVLSRHPNESKEYYAQYDVKVIPNLDHSSSKAARGRRFYGFNKGDDTEHLVKIRNEIKHSDLVIIGGGDAFFDISNGIYRGPGVYLALICTIARFFEKPIFLAGISVVPFHTSEGLDIAKHICENSEIIALRDKNSIKVLANNGINVNENKVHILPDPAIGLDSCLSTKLNTEFNQLQNCSNNRILIGISLRSMYWKWDSALLSNFYDKMAAICDELIDKFSATLVFIPHCYYNLDGPEQDDRYINQNVLSKMTNPEYCVQINEYHDVRSVLKMYKSLNLVIGMRHHSVVFATRACVPSIALSYSLKVKSFMEEFGLDDYVISIDEITIERILSATDKILKSDTEIRKYLCKTVDLQRKRWRTYLDLIISLAEKGC